MSEQKTHRLVKAPQISARYLADYMAASDIKKRSIIVGCKYQPITRIVQHDDAKLTISKFLRSGEADTTPLSQEAAKLRARLADSEFDRDVYDHNADYIDRFALNYPALALPDAERQAPGAKSPIEIEGVKVTTDLQMRLRRLTKTNKVRIGAVMLRYSKGAVLKPTVGAWQSAFLFGFLMKTSTEAEAEPEHKLCITIDAQSGTYYVAPTDTVSRFKNMEAACAAIAERWDNIPPPPKAVF
ncbi:hypothetical protein OIU35_20315 [Boseaceae bacterium BT-24-1]|nr:hypothetical protein [Boseaceae bacterium BT-24-1]